MTNLAVQCLPGPRILAAALKIAGFSETSYYPAVTDNAGVVWPKPNGLQIALAIVGGESAGNAWCYHTNKDGSNDFGILQINSKWHPEYFNQPDDPTAWNWMNYLDNAKAAYQIHADSNFGWSAWNAYSNGGYLHVRWAGAPKQSWMYWANYGVVSMKASLATGKSLNTIASILNDPLAIP